MSAPAEDPVAPNADGVESRRSVAVVGYGVDNVSIYCEQIRNLFADRVELRRRYVGRYDAREDADADLILFPSFDAYERSCRAVELPPNVLFGSRTVSREGYELVASIPAGERVCLLDETIDMARHMSGVLLQEGIRHLDILPVSSENASLCRDRIVILLGHSAIEPDSPRDILNIGGSLLDVGTILDLGFRLGLGSLLNRQNIRESYCELMTTNVGLAEVIGRTNRNDGFLDILLRATELGVVAVDAEKRVFAYNERARSILGLSRGELFGENADALLPRLPFARALETKSPIKDGSSREGSGEVLHAVDPILHSGVLYGAVAVLKPAAEEPRPATERERMIGAGYRARYTFGDILGTSTAITRCKTIARRMADSTSSVLISGESGTGKEMFAQAIHNASGRRGRPFVAVNCGALPESLLESELFGYEEGAFTGARRGGKRGLFELAQRGTLFLDEVGEMPLNLQMRLLRVLEEREIMRLGSDRLIAIDIRVIAATHRDLREMVEDGSFREDLYYRLAVLPLDIPPLRERPEDIPVLLDEFQRAYDFRFELSGEAEAAFLRHRFRGNCRELRNYVEFIANLGIRRVGIGDLPFTAEGAAQCADGSVPGSSPVPGSSVPAGAADQERRILLEELDAAYKAGRRLGRRSLARQVRARGLFLGEQEVRLLLKVLEAEGLVIIHPGKAGTVITEAGRDSITAAI